MAKQDVNAERAARLITALREQRDQQAPYPLTLARLREIADPQASDEELFKAATHKSAAGQLLVVGKKDLNSPVALAGDEAALASSGVLLEYALSRLASADKPLHPLAKIVKKLDPSLQPAFEAAVQERVASNTLPPGVGVQVVKGQPLLYLERFPPPPPPLPKKTPAAELAERLLAALAERQQRGEAIAALAELAGEEAKPALVKKAVDEPAFRSNVVLLQVTKTLVLVSPAASRDALLASDRLLLELLRARTTPKRPFAALADLVAGLPDGTREALLHALTERMAGNRLPAGVLVRSEGERTLLGLEDHLAPLDRLRTRVLAALAARRASGAGYPATLTELLGGAGDVPEEVRAKLPGDKALKTRVLFAVPSDPGSPVVLAGDADVLARSERVLEYAVSRISTAEAPLHPLKKVAGQLEKTVRAAFEAAAEERIARGDLPAEIAVHEVKGKPHLRLARHPLPKLPEPAEVVLAGKLLGTLRHARETGHGYPMTLETLLHQAGAKPGDRAVKAALGLDVVKVGVVVAVPGHPASPVALAGDQNQLAADERLLPLTLTVTRTDDNQAAALADLGKRVAADLREPFLKAAGERLTGGTLPAGIGSLVIKKKPHLFLLADVGRAPAGEAAGPVEEPQPPAPGPGNFARAFAEAFERLDREHGSNNQVSLVRLRQELPVERDVFDRELAALRRSGQYFLEGAEGRGGLTDEERAAGILEHDQLLLYVGRRGQEG